MIKLQLCACFSFHLFVLCGAWPRYGRPHPLYNSRQQSNENLFINAIMLGLDFNEILALQTIFGQGHGFGNFGLHNNDFPMNAYERNRARQDMDILNALGVIENNEEVAVSDWMNNRNAPDPSDKPSPRERGENGDRKPRAKGPSKRKWKPKGKVTAPSDKPGRRERGENGDKKPRAKGPNKGKAKPKGKRQSKKGLLSGKVKLAVRPAKSSKGQQAL